MRGAALKNEKVEIVSHEVISEIKHMAEKDKEYIYKNGAGECLFSFDIGLRSLTICLQTPRAPSTSLSSPKPRLHGSLNPNSSASIVAYYIPDYGTQGIRCTNSKTCLSTGGVRVKVDVRLESD